MNSQSETNYTLLAQEDHDDIQRPDDVEPDDEDFGGPEVRIQLERKLLRKLDAKMSILVLLFILNCMDGDAMAAARLHGFEDDLHLWSWQYNQVVGCFYMGYVLMQIPSNMLLDHLGKPSVYLPCCMIGWGLFSILTGFAQDYVDALYARFFVGFFQAALFPGALFLLSKWYKRNELGLRTAVFFCGGLIAKAVGPPLASIIIGGLEGKKGDGAWRRLFYIEGSLVIVVALLAIPILPDFPSTSRFLSPIECELAMKRVEEEVGEGGDSNETEDGSGPFAGLKLSIKDIKVWWLALATAFFVGCLSFDGYLSTVSAALGYARGGTYLLRALPWVFAAGVTVAVCRHSDKAGQRSTDIIVSLLVGHFGLFLAWRTSSSAVEYFAMFLMVQQYAGYACLLAWASNCIPRPPAKRAVALAFISAFSQFGNIDSSESWRDSARSGTLRFLWSMFMNVIVILLCWMFRMMLVSHNFLEEKIEVREGRSKGWRYML